MYYWKSRCLYHSLGCPLSSLSNICIILTLIWNEQPQLFIIPPVNEVVGGILVSLRPSVCPSVRPSRLPCPLCNIYSSGWILSILATNDHYHERVCRTQWLLILTYIFKVIRPWLRKLCPLWNFDSSGWIFFYIWHKWLLSLEGLLRVTIFSESKNLNFWQIFEIFWPWPWKKTTVLDGLFPYLAQMITNMKGCVAYNALWPWPISLRSFGLGLENRVRSVASTVFDGFFPYFIQIITSMSWCVACDDLWPWPLSSRSFDLENRVHSVTFSVLDR